MNRDSFTAYFLLLGCFIWAAGVVGLSLLLLVVAMTVEGRCFAVTGITLGLLPVILFKAWQKHTRRFVVVGLILVVLFTIGAVVVIRHTPSGLAPKQARALNIYADGNSPHRRCVFSSLLPEVDQLMLGFTLMPAADPLFTWQQARELKSLTAAIYRELEADPAFHELGSAMPYVYDELLEQNTPRGHSYLYIPTAVDRTKPSPVLIFLHGSGGNFKAYLWLLSQLADRLNFIVIAPSYGMGNWRWPETGLVVDAALASAKKHVSIAEDNIHVMGLSNGGLAVSQLAQHRGAQYRSLIFISPVFAPESLRSYSFASECKQSNVLILTGGLDDRVPLDYVRDNASGILKVGAKVTFEVESKADHFLFFSHRERVRSTLESWLAAQAR